MLFMLDLRIYQTYYIKKYSIQNKKKYVKLIPYTWQLINYRMKNNKAFDNLRLLLNENFPKVLGK